MSRSGTRGPHPATGRPVSPAQRQFWLLDQFSPDTPLYNVCRAVRLSGPLNAVAIGDSIQEIARRHETLRSVFPGDGGNPVLRITPAPPSVGPMIDLTALPEDARVTERDTLIRQHTRRPFDLEHGPLLRAALVRESDDQHTLILSLHHIVTDGWSMTILVNELFEIYSSRVENRPAGLSSLPVQYPEVAANLESWRTSGECERQLRYWRTRLEGLAHAVKLPLDQPADSRPDFVAATEHLSWGKDMLARLSTFARAERATLFMVLLTAFKIALSRHTDSDDVVVGTACALRDDPATESLIGPFLNMVTLRTDLPGELTARQALARVRRTCLEAYDHQDVGFEDVVSALAPGRSAVGNPFFETVFQLVAAAESRRAAGGLTVRAEQIEPGLAKFGLSLNIVRSTDGLDIFAEYNTSFYRAKTIRGLLDHWHSALGSMLDEPDAPIARILMTTPAERRLALATARGTGTRETAGPRSGYTSILDLFEEWADRFPHALAVVSNGTRLSYGELEQAANRLAHRLRREGARAGSRVGIFMERSAETIVSVLAVWKAEAAYVPLDLDSPEQRRKLILRDAGADLVLTSASLVPELENCGARIITVDSGDRHRERIPVGRPARSIAPESLCYVIYTSGSTGRPKGVMVTHGGLLRIQDAWERAFRLRGRLTAHLQMANFSFDGFLGEFARCFGSGATLVICPREILMRPERILELMRRENVDAADFVPPVLRELVGYARRTGNRLDFLDLIIVGSDTVPADELARVQRLAGPSTRVVNCYGLTEGTIDSTYFTISPAERYGPTVFIGTPLPGTEAYILDEELRPVPPGVSGTLFIAGPTLARGYLAAPGQTAGAFIPHPFSARPGARMYRTGDRARYRHTASGLQIEFLGRKDRQLKIRGYRVELDEIEAAFRRVPGVKDVAVIAVDDGSMSKRVHSYIVPDSEEKTTDWYGVLRENLPLYMIPERVALLSALPLTPNGKLDSATLATLCGTEIRSPLAPVIPRTRTERRLADIWKQLLEREEIGVHDDFFANGGNSLLAMRFISIMNGEYGISVSVRAFFKASTVARLATVVDDLAANASPAVTSLGEILPAERRHFHEPLLSALRRSARRSG
jgi:amino acid adenylation domain-containing protein